MKARRELSSQAQVAKLCKAFCKSLGVKSKATSSSFSMGDSVRIEIQNQPPLIMKQIKEYCKQFQYGHFDSMTDYYDQSNRRDDIPQTKFMNVENSFDDSLKQTTWEWLKNKINDESIKNLPDDYHEASKNYNIQILGHFISSMVLLALLDKLDITSNCGSVWDVINKPHLKLFNNNPDDASETKITHHKHTKKGFDMYIVTFNKKLDRDDFIALRHDAKLTGGWYSRKWGTTPSGFAFKNEIAASQWLNNNKNILADQLTKITSEKALKKDNTKLVGKWRKLADGLQKSIDDKFADRLANTPKRMAQADMAKVEGYKLKRTQKVMYKMAGLIEKDLLPEKLKEVKSKKHVLELMSSKLEQVNYGYHYSYVCTGKPRNEDVITLLMWSLLDDDNQNQKLNDELERKKQNLLFSKIEGFYPTPEKIVSMMIEYAELEANHSILEPSAGFGSIIDGIEKTNHQGIVMAIEINYSLCEILQLKGYDCQPKDFMSMNTPEEFLFDRVIMNPPFEKQTDLDHIERALKFLKPGGVLVAICSESIIFRSNKKTRDFYKNNLDKNHYEFVSLEAGEFKGSGTNVKTQLLKITKAR